MVRNPTEEELLAGVNDVVHDYANLVSSGQMAMTGRLNKLVSYRAFPTQ
jgi:hypothetical protein